MQQKRTLTHAEIEEILQDIVPEAGIPPETAKSIIDNIKKKMHRALSKYPVYPAMKKYLRENISKNYQRSKISYGEIVGISVAQSFGQFQTQSTLNSFHKAGLTEKTVVSGVARFKEILDATKNPKGNSCIIKFTEKNTNLQELRKAIGDSLVYMDLERLCESFTPVFEKHDEKWYDAYEKVYGSALRDYDHRITLKFKKRLVYEHNISLQKIANIIEDAYSDLTCVCSPLSEAQIDVFVDMAAAEIPVAKLKFVTPKNASDVYLKDIVIPNLEKLHVCGIPTLADMFFVHDKATGTWHVETDGGDFGRILAAPNVDTRNTTSNHIWQIYWTLGVEAVRQYILDECEGSMHGVSTYHSTLLVDKMMHNGSIMSISRYGMRSGGTGAIAKASFEESIDNFHLAALRGECESTDSVSAAITCGRLGIFGSGMCELQIDTKRLEHLMSERVVERIVERAQ